MKLTRFQSNSSPDFMRLDRSLSKCLRGQQTANESETHQKHSGTNHLSTVKSKGRKMTGFPETPSQKPIKSRDQSLECANIYVHDVIDPLDPYEIATGFPETQSHFSFDS